MTNINRQNKIINAIQSARSKNNKNWMDLLRLAFKLDPFILSTSIQNDLECVQIPYHVLHPFVFNIAHSGIHGCFFKACPRSDLVIPRMSFSRTWKSRSITANHVST